MASEIIQYRGFELHLDPQGSGLQACIWQGSLYFVQPALRCSADKSLREKLIADAKAAVDTLLNPPQRIGH
jgi:hypothetical protein